MSILDDKSESTSLPIDYPASETYDQLTPEQIKALCEVDTPENQMFRKMPDWTQQSEARRRFYRLKAYWTLRGATDPGGAAVQHPLKAEPYDETWGAFCAARGWRYWRPTTLRELEKEFLPQATPNIRLIINRCPQMAMIHALRGDVCEPLWWAALSITEHATPNFSRECSDGYPNFAECELNERTARIHREETKPALCHRLDAISPGVCSVCKFRGEIRSPIALGYEHEPKLSGNSP
jgi:hypothetical protein